MRQFKNKKTGTIIKEVKAWLHPEGFMYPVEWVVNNKEWEEVSSKIKLNDWKIHWSEAQAEHIEELVDRIQYLEEEVYRIMKVKTPF